MIIVIIRLCRAGLLDVDDAQMRRATRAFRRRHQHLHPRRIGGLQPRERQSLRTVLMLQQPRDFRRRAGRRKIPPQQLRRRRDLRLVIGRTERFAVALRAALLDEIENQTDAMALGDGPHLMFAIRVERRETHLRKLRAAQVHHDLAPRVTNHQFPAAMRRGQSDHQRAEHAARLLRVAMREKKTARVIHQQFVKLGRHRHSLATQPRDDLLEKAIETRRPRLAAEPHLVRCELPHLAHRFIENGVFAPPVRRACRPLEERGYLRWRHGKRQHPHALDLHLRQRNLHRAMHKEIPRPLDAGEQLLQRRQILIVFHANRVSSHARRLLAAE